MCFCVYTYVFDDLVQHGWVEGDEEGEGDGDSEVKGELEGLQSNTLPAGTAASTKHNELTQLVHVVAAPLSLSLSLPQFFFTFFIFYFSSYDVSVDRYIYWNFDNFGIELTIRLLLSASNLRHTNFRVTEVVSRERTLASLNLVE